MRVDLYSLKEREAKLQRWHLWFAWYPVRINERQIAFWEKVQRKLIAGSRKQYYVYAEAEVEFL